MLLYQKGTGQDVFSAKLPTGSKFEFIPEDARRTTSSFAALYRTERTSSRFSAATFFDFRVFDTICNFVEAIVWSRDARQELRPL